MTRLDRCKVCDAPAEWSVRYSEHVGRRDANYEFSEGYYCEAHLPADAKERYAKDQAYWAGEGGK